MTKMETTFYHEENFLKMERNNTDNVSQLKRNMTLDFAQGSSAKRKYGNLLQSPDLNMLKLASPELERMIIQANGMVTTTPTPTQLLYPKYVTEEQEDYAKGFVDALNQLKESENPHYTTLTTATPTTIFNHLTQQSSNNLYTTSSALNTNANSTPSPPKVMHSSRDIPHSSSSTINQALHVNVKEEPQTVPCMANSPPMSPIDMDNQERIKVERKRARNRIAARKCRTRKLERINRLEDHVSDLKGKNADLIQTATSLREQVCKLKQQIMEHVDGGCRVMMGNGASLS